ncbi:Golgi resident protein GCP60 [Trichomycterus rosablanca]|uniref:Golgi resident protein GCP60 n=1 Tax=Trichomycterus rosablanca TaxID=2290929 RepID=UPI002F359B69
MAALEPRVLDTEVFEKASENGDDMTKQQETEETRQESEEQTKWNIESNWGFSLEELYALGLKFFKEMNGKAFNPTYEDNLHFVALQKQVSLGPYNAKACPEVGFFDVLGNDRRKKWAQLGSMAKEDAMEDFVKLLNSCCSRFSPYVTSHKIKKEEQERQLREEERLRVEKEQQERREEEQRQEEERRKIEEKRRQEADSLLIEQQKQQVMAALNARTAMYFQQYAAQQFPDNPDQQKLLILQLQEQHYQQYIQQAYQQYTAEAPSPVLNDKVPEGNLISQSESLTSEEKETNQKSGRLFIETKSGELPILAPSMWTRPQIKEFKEKMKQDAESVLSVGRGEVLTVRIPTNKDGSFFFWEFATDHYDIAFGLYFEWSNAENISKLADTEESASENGESGHNKEESGKSKNVSEVVQLCRHDSHEDVYAGSHQYPGQGAYLLKFDNSYSLWRPKIVYYRVYYTR